MSSEVTAEAERARAEAERERKAKWDRERPIREPLLAAHAHCGYRECAQGHETQVHVGDTSPLPSWRVGCCADVLFREQYSLHRLWVRPDWAATVGRRAATIDMSASECRVVLSAQPYRVRADGAVLWSLATVKQGRGTAVECASVWAVFRNGAWHKQKDGAPATFKSLHPEVQFALAALEDDQVRAFFAFAPDTPDPILADWLQDRDVDGPALDVLRRVEG